jgi:hypothetical protein
MFQFCNEAVNLLTTGITEMQGVYHLTRAFIIPDGSESSLLAQYMENHSERLESRAIAQGIKHTSFQRTPELTCHPMIIGISYNASIS